MDVCQVGGVGAEMLIDRATPRKSVALLRSSGPPSIPRHIAELIRHRQVVPICF